MVTGALLLATLLQLASPLRFAWLSDTHVGSETGAEDLQRAVEEITRLKDLNFVVLTGDVTEFGSNHQLTEAQNILAGLAVPCCVLPGNHDTKWSESGCTMFPRLWGAERFSFALGGYFMVGFHQGPRMRMADGHFAPEDLAWLDSVLAVPSTRNLPVIVFTHYPLDSSISNWYEALQRLRKRDTRMVFVGHGHRNRVLAFEGIPGLMGRSTLRAGKPSGGFNVVTLFRDSIIVSERLTGAPEENVWFRGVLRPAHAPHPNGGGDAVPTLPDMRQGIPHERWNFRCEGAVLAPAAAGEKLVVIADSRGYVYGLDAETGERKWRSTLDGPVYSAPTTAGPSVVVGTVAGSLFLLSLQDGSIIWHRNLGAPVLGTPAVADSIIYVGASDYRMHALGVRTGREVWSSDPVRGFFEAKPAIASDLILIGAWDGSFHAFDRSTGRLRWSWSGDRSNVLLSPAACWPVLAGERVFITAPDRKLTCLDVRSGALIWRTAEHQVRETIGLSEDSTVVFVRTMRDSIISFCSTSQQLSHKWISPLGFGYDINAAQIVSRDDRVYYGTMRGVLYCLDYRTGGLVWSKRISRVTLNSVLPLDRGGIVVTDFDGNVWRIDG